MKDKFTLKGHGSFYIREGWFTKGLVEIEKNPELFSKKYNEGADALGVGSVMAKAIKYWLTAAGLIVKSAKESPLNYEVNKGNFISATGKIILDNDKYIENKDTLWIIHYNIASNYEYATIWNLFFNNVSEEKFSRRELEGMMESELEKKIYEHKYSESSLSNDCAVLLQMYFDENKDKNPEEKMHCPLSELHLITKSRNVYCRNEVKEKDISCMAVLYGICGYLENAGLIEKKDRTSVSIEKLLEGENSPGKLFGINRITLNESLDALEQKGYLTIDRTAGLDTVYFEKDSIMTRAEVIKYVYA